MTIRKIGLFIPSSPYGFQIKIHLKTFHLDRTATIVSHPSSMIPIRICHFDHTIFQHLFSLFTMMNLLQLISKSPSTELSSPGLQSPRMPFSRVAIEGAANFWLLTFINFFSNSFVGSLNLSRASFERRRYQYKLLLKRRKQKIENL